MSYIVKNEYGAFCSVCQSQLSIEEEDWDTCDACGGEGIGSDEDGADIAEAEEALADTGERVTLETLKAKLQN